MMEIISLIHNLDLTKDTQKIDKNFTLFQQHLCRKKASEHTQKSKHPYPHQQKLQIPLIRSVATLTSKESHHIGTQWKN